MNKQQLYRSLNITRHQNPSDEVRIKIGLIDGSIDVNHPDLSSASIEIIAGDSCHSSESEGCRHGTFLAGILVANTSSKAPGLCPDTVLVSRPIFCQANEVKQCPVVSEETLIEAMTDCLKAQVNVINLSLGISDPNHQISSRLRAIYDQAQKQGVLIIAASGNQGTKAVSPLVKHPWVISVGATDHQGKRLTSSNYGVWKNHTGLFAPAYQITSLTPVSGVTKMTGTSVASAITTGVAVKLWTLFPSACANTIKQALTGITKDISTPIQLNFDASYQRLKQIKANDYSLTDIELSSIQETRTMDYETVAEKGCENTPNTDQQVTPTENQQGEIEPQSCDCKSNSQEINISAKVANQNIYAVGVIKPIFPSLDIQKEFERAAETLGVAETDFYGVFGATNNPYGYLAEQMCWALNINNIDVYLIKPRSQIELTDIIESLKPSLEIADEVLSVVIGYQRNGAALASCAGLTLPEVECNQVYYFTLAEITQNLTSQNLNTEAISDVIKSIEFKPNNGVMAQDRALNYLAFRYPEIYRKTASLKDANSNPSGEAHFLVNVETQQSSVSSDRTVIDIIFKYQSKTSGEQSFWYCGIDVTGQFPFLNTPLRTYVPIKQ